FELRVYQTQSREPGYRLVYLPGGEPTLAIYRSSRSGIVQIARDDGDLDLGRDRASRLVWERDPDGRMRVRIGDETVLEVTDTLFREAWTGLLLINAAGDFS